MSTPTTAPTVSRNPTPAHCIPPRDLTQPQRAALLQKLQARNPVRVPSTGTPYLPLVPALTVAALTVVAQLLRPDDRPDAQAHAEVFGENALPIPCALDCDAPLNTLQILQYILAPIALHHTLASERTASGGIPPWDCARVDAVGEFLLAWAAPLTAIAQRRELRALDAGRARREALTTMRQTTSAPAITPPAKIVIDTINGLAFLFDRVPVATIWHAVDLCNASDVEVASQRFVQSVGNIAVAMRRRVTPIVRRKSGPRYGGLLGSVQESGPLRQVV